MSPSTRTIHLVDPPRSVPLKAQLVALFGGVICPPPAGSRTSHAEEAFFYDPRDPRQAYPVDGLPGKVTIGANGQIDASKATVLALLLPFLALFMLLVTGLTLIP